MPMAISNFMDFPILAKLDCASFLPKAPSTLICLKDIVELPETLGLKPVELELKLHRGVWISGTVTSRTSGKPVANAELVYTPARNNKQLKEVTGFQQGNDRYHEFYFDHYKTDANGHFRFAALSGPGVIAVKNHIQLSFAKVQDTIVSSNA